MPLSTTHNQQTASAAGTSFSSNRTEKNTKKKHTISRTTITKTSKIKNPLRVQLPDCLWWKICVCASSVCTCKFDLYDFLLIFTGFLPLLSVFLFAKISCVFCVFFVDFGKLPSIRVLFCLVVFLKFPSPRLFIFSFASDLRICGSCVQVFASGSLFQTILAPADLKNLPRICVLRPFCGPCARQKP